MDRLRFAVTLGVALLMTFGAGCVKPIGHTAQTDIVATEGIERTRERLRDVMTRSPWITPGSVVVNEQNVTFQALGRSRSLIFSDIVKVDVYANNNTFSLDRAGGIVDKIMFSSEAEAREYADLMASLHAHAVDPGASPGTPTPSAPTASTDEPPAATSTTLDPPIAVHGDEPPPAGRCPNCNAKATRPGRCSDPDCGSTW